MKKTMRAMTGLLAGTLAVGCFAGCGRKNITSEDYPTTVVATFGDTKVYLDEANYLARTSQYSSEYIYSMYGMDISDMWDSDSSMGDMQTYLKTNTMAAIYQTLVLDKKAEELGLSLTDAEKEMTADTVQQWIDETPDSVKAVVSMDETMLQNIADKNALAMKAYQYAIKDVDTNVTDEEAQQHAIQYYKVAEDDNNDADAAEALAEELIADVKAGNLPSSDTADTYDNVTYSDVTFGEGDYGNELETLGLSLNDGESGYVYDEDEACWYVVYCESALDRDATDSKKEEIISDREDELFETTYAEWVDSMPSFKVNENVWGLISFDKNLYVTETEAETEAAEEIETAEETEAAEETDAAEETAAEADTTAAEETESEETTAAQ